MRRLSWVVLATALFAGTGLAAITKNSTLYVRSRNTRLVDKPNGKVLATLQPGTEVIWLGTAPNAPGWHLVKVGKRSGALLTANLATKPPSREVVATQGTKSIDQATFLSSAAATKALAPAAVEYGNNQADMKKAVAQVEAMERLSDAVTPEALSAHAQKRRLVGSAPAVAVGSAR